MKPAKFTYQTGKKNTAKTTLIESSNLVAVRTIDDLSLSKAIKSKEGKRLKKQFDVHEHFGESNVTVLKAKKTNKKEGFTQRDKTREALKKEKNVRFAGRVLMDEKSKEPVLYTENFFLKFKDGVSEKNCNSIIEKKDLTVKRKLEFATNSYFICAKAGTGWDVFKIAQELLKLPQVELCQPELIRKKGMKLIHSNQWHLKKTTIGKIDVDAHANVEAAHAITEGEGITIAVIDDGVDTLHEEFNLPGKVIAPYDATRKIADGNPKLSGESHGTCCAGVATAAGKFQASGVAPKAKLIPIRLASGLGSITEAEAIHHAVKNGADIISCSWGPADGEWWTDSDVLHKQKSDLAPGTKLAIDNAVKNGRKGKGCIITFAAGNGNENCDIDGYISYENVIAIAACNDTNSRSVYSDFGNCVWVCFPSSDFGWRRRTKDESHPEPLTKGIWTTDRTGKKGESKKGNGNYDDSFGGTSSACPGVAGVIALMLSVNPDLTFTQVKNILRDTADKIDLKNGKYKNGHSKFYGYGRVNAEKAVKKAKAMKK